MKRRFLVVHLLLLALLVLSHGYHALKSPLFVLEVVVVLLFIVLAIVGFMLMSRATLAALYILGLLNAILIYTTSGFPWVGFLAPLLGYGAVLATPSKAPRKMDHSFSYEGPKSMVFEAPAVAKEFSPGKFIASSSSNKYHAPKCEWAKKIKKNRRVWFTDSKEAKKKGYSKHSCL